MVKCKVCLTLCAYASKVRPGDGDLPYSGKLSRDKTFANFADSEPFVKVFSGNFEGRVSQESLSRRVSICACANGAQGVKRLND